MKYRFNWKRLVVLWPLGMLLAFAAAHLDQATGTLGAALVFSYGTLVGYLSVVYSWVLISSEVNDART